MSLPMIPRYTLICYRANGGCWLRGCLEKSCDSEHAMHTTVDAKEAAAHWGQRLFEDSTRQSPVREWEVTLLINGWPQYGDARGGEEMSAEFDALFDSVAEEARNEFRRLNAIEEERLRKVEQEKEEARQATERSQAAARQALEHKEYQRLHRIYGSK